MSYRHLTLDQPDGTTLIFGDPNLENTNVFLKVGDNSWQEKDRHLKSSRHIYPDEDIATWLSNADRFEIPWGFS